MIDNRIYTFLELCNVMNYHKTAERLNMTQPAVTQHIQYFEQRYHCKLFEYAGKKLAKTPNCLALERYARSIIALEHTAAQTLAAPAKQAIRIGATKTIGEYVLDDALPQLLLHPDYECHLTIDNTEKLLARLNHFQLDVLLLEGFVDKAQYEHQRLSRQEIVGICAPDHPFAGQCVPLSEVFAQKVALREQGSGTRAVLEQFLAQHGYSTAAFATQSVLSSNKLLACAAAQGLAISFVYDVLPRKDKNLATFTLKEGKILHEFNYVFLNRDKAEGAIALLGG
ncbi:MAG: LysR family transcriptional regulator [Faecalibacterium sp.]